ncbi:MAG: BON domain-containing protein [Gammaproteobacteria bacterium]|nr:BON domain-containing protein [Gammaproteobacteria bacterium]
MSNKTVLFKYGVVFGASLLVLNSCGGENSSTMSESSLPIVSNISDNELAIDERIKTQVELAVASAKDLPSGFTVQVTEGIVLITGSVVCDDCGGMRTPGHIGTIQQSLGGVVRAIPGVMSVNFDLSYGPNYPARTL